MKSTSNKANHKYDYKVVYDHLGSGLPGVKVFHNKVLRAVWFPPQGKLEVVRSKVLRSLTTTERHRVVVGAMEALHLHLMGVKEMQIKSLQESLEAAQKQLEEVKTENKQLHSDIVLVEHQRSCAEAEARAERAVSEYTLARHALERHESLHQTAQE